MPVPASIAIRAGIRRGSGDAALVLALALAVRLAVIVVSPGGFTGDFGYDASVYYTASDLLLHGRVPYGDFVLLHPPGLMLVLTPFAALGRLTTDHTGFVVASVAFAVLGAVNAALVVQIARRCGLTRGAALLGGAFYAVWDGTVVTEVAARLEPLGTFFFLTGLLVLLRRPAPGARALAGSGGLLGLAASVKIWWSIPVLVVIAWQLVPVRTRRRSLPMALGTAVTLVLVNGPFFLAAPAAMWRMVVTDQLGRPGVGTSPVSRLLKLTSLRPATTHLGGVGSLVLVAALVLITAVVVAAGRVPAGRLFVAVAVAQVLVLLASPTFFSYYPGYIAGPLALVVAAGAHGHGSRVLSRGGLAAAAGVVGLAAVCTAVSADVGTLTASQRLPSARLARAVASVHCLVADSPMALIAADALSRDAARGCPNWGDVSGRTYDTDSPVSARQVARVDNLRWQADVRRYLLSGNAVLLIRSATGLSRATRLAVTDHPVLARLPGVTVYRTGPAPGG